MSIGDRRWRDAVFTQRHVVTGDPRRWPDVWLTSAATNILTDTLGTGVYAADDPRLVLAFSRIAHEHMRVTDRDLTAAVVACLLDWYALPTRDDLDAECVLIAISDAAIDEQDRRNAARRTGVIQEASP